MSVDRKTLYRKKRYGVFSCYRCHSPNLSNMFQKGHTCTGCGRILRLDKVHILFGSDKMDEALAYLQELKKQSALSRGEMDFTSADKLKV